MSLSLSLSCVDLSLSISSWGLFEFGLCAFLL
jgi:hypothetical protein